MKKYKFIGSVPKTTDLIGVTVPNQVMELNEEQAAIADKSPEFKKIRDVKLPKTKKGDE